MICAGSLAAKTSGIALGERLTSHPSVKGELEKRECCCSSREQEKKLNRGGRSTDYRYSEDRVVVSGNLVTS